MYIQVGLLINILVAKQHPLVVLFDSNRRKIPQGRNENKGHVFGD